MGLLPDEAAGRMTRDADVLEMDDDHGCSKTVENHVFAVALHRMYRNFVRIHSMLRMFAAMAAGVWDRLWGIGDIVALVEAEEAA
ncbi:hypothetical protein BHK69_15940 [Bosea vaviloviae]|uniref:Uncharacterized protein n=1 Tax=Bosea vaviloviae TaxID=1526658 RepID=A0A1D7U2Z5_9HYPH|nr:hypothetical protein BHK69_15940 [Bosea vaviloviae]